MDHLGPHNIIALKRKSDNSSEIETSADGRARVVIRLNLVKNQADDVEVNDDVTDLMHGAQVALYLVQPWEPATPA